MTIYIKIFRYFFAIKSNVCCFVCSLFHSKVFHVRSVTQGDVIRADAKDIPRIFQLLYAGEGEARRPGESQDTPADGAEHAGECAVYTWAPV